MEVTPIRFECTKVFSFLVVLLHDLLATVANAKKKVTGDTLAVKQPPNLQVNVEQDVGALSGLDLPSTSAATSTDILSTTQQQEIDEENLSHVLRKLLARLK